jgi:hypothetical protein
MHITNLQKFKPKKLIVFDFDGTLAATKSAMDKEMSVLVARLLGPKKVAVIGGGKYQIFQELFVRQLRGPKKLLHNLFLFPTTATAFYRYHSGWSNVYALGLSKKEKEKINKTFKRVLKEVHYEHPKKIYGQVIEDRGSQITWSAVGQDVVKILGTKEGVALKEKWTKENKAVKMKITKLMTKYLPELEIRAAGYTSIDVTKKGIDKAYGLRQIEKHLHIKIKDMLFVGDAIFPGGNDYAIVKTGVDYVKVKGPEETKKIIREILKQK